MSGGGGADDDDDTFMPAAYAEERRPAATAARTPPPPPPPPLTLTPPAAAATSMAPQGRVAPVVSRSTANERYPHEVPAELSDLRRPASATLETGARIRNALHCLTVAQIIATSRAVESAAADWYASHPTVPYLDPRNPDPRVILERVASEVSRVPVDEYERTRPVSNFVPPHWFGPGGPGGVF